MRILVILMLIFLGISCSQKKTAFNYFIFSKQDSISAVWRYDSNYSKYIPPPPPPPPPPYLEWYSNLVMIFDTANRIYLYQTERIERRFNYKLGHKYIYPSEFPNFIDLSPEKIITLHSDYLMDFLSDNEEYFRFDTNYRETKRIFYIVSDFDTITNPAYYRLLDHIKTSKFVRNRVFYLIRRTTEEEKNVLSCKRLGKNYDVHDFEWTNNFIDGKTKPLTYRYDSLESISVFLIKSKETFKPEMTYLGNIQ